MKMSSFERGLSRLFGMTQCQWWREPDLTDIGDGCPSTRMWQVACNTLVAPNYERAWQNILDASPSDTYWHSIRNCTAYQANVWGSLQTSGFPQVTHGAGFILALALRHVPTELSVKLLAELLSTHPQARDLMSYILALLTDDESLCCVNCHSTMSELQTEPDIDTDNPQPAPLRDLHLFGDCELAIYAADREHYDSHAKLIRNEFTHLSHEKYVELRIKLLDQLSRSSRIFQSEEFEQFEATARDNIQREITYLREQLLTNTKE